MKTVTSFESSTPEQELAEAAEEKFDYSQVASALKHDQSVAENVYARCAKHHFRKRVGDGTQLAKEAPLPIWVATASVTLIFDGQLDPYILEALTEALAASIQDTRKERKVVLVDALHTKISEVGAKTFTFSLKQKWGLIDE